ncbi:hemolysin III [Plasmodium sp. DRC-Itaito]|nr:hemolysin III [Plasmodium sp. DRC-Itaito]
MEFYKNIFSNFRNTFNGEYICDVKGSKKIDDNEIANFIKCTDLCENDKKIIELYIEKKINKNMLIKYMDRKNKTLFRGKIHLMLVFMSPLWIFYMLYLSKTLIARIFTSIAILCIFFNFSASFLLHNFEWKPKCFFIMEKLDHFGIFLMISGSLLPVQALLFNKIKLLFFISLQFFAILFGCLIVFFSCFSWGNRSIRSLVFIIAGLLHIIFIKDYLSLLHGNEFTLLMLLGVLYIIGAIIYSLKKPNIVPGILEFHEVFHICCLGSAVCTFVLNCSVIKRT